MVFFFLSQADPKLAEIILACPLPPLESTRDVFHDLASCIIEQQIHYRSTKKIFARLLAKAGIKRLSPENFPVFEIQALSGIKISLRKFETLNALLDFWQKEEPTWETMRNEEVRNTLGQIPGIGPWTMDMILLYTLGRPDIVPYEDFHLRQMMVQVYGLNPQNRLKTQMKTITQTWEAHSSLAVRYLLAWKAYMQTK
ncbi:MAG: DNA-3-methyladenine glycosylase 2 family protein [Microscillaceae bacterium]|nr:DNA-3-methyladenine glycosylase 2 family protein [Microscillaceae bacterium]